MSRKLPDGEKNRFRDTHETETMPREQFKRAENPQTVSDEALVAVLLRTGTHGCDVLTLARRLRCCAGVSARHLLGSLRL